MRTPSPMTAGRRSARGVPRSRCCPAARRLRCARRCRGARRPARRSRERRAGERVRPARRPASGIPPACDVTPVRPAQPHPKKSAPAACSAGTRPYQNRRTYRPECDRRSPVRKRRYPCSRASSARCPSAASLETRRSAAVVGDHHAVLIDFFGFDQADRRERTAFLVECDQRIEIGIGEIVAAHDDERFGENDSSGLSAPALPISSASCK